MALPKRMRDQTREIAKVHTRRDSQQQGEATRLLHSVCEEADAAGVTLILWPRPYGGDVALSQGQLLDWYAKFGFYQIQPEPPLMARMPWSTPQYLTPTASGVALYA